MKTSGNTILMAGGTSGIGLELALRLQRAGNKVIVAGRRRHLLGQIAADHPGIEGEVFDVADEESVKELFATVTAKHPELNVVVAMAGIMRPERVLEPESIDIAERTVATNLLGTIRLVHTFAPFLTGQSDAAIVTVTSGLAYVPLPISPTYSATKAAVHSYTESLRVQLRDTSVQVIELAPPLTATDLVFREADRQYALPLDEFADEVMDLLASEPDAHQILVKRVKRQRFAEANGNYDEVLAGQSGL